MTDRHRRLGNRFTLASALLLLLFLSAGTRAPVSANPAAESFLLFDVAEPPPPDSDTCEGPAIPTCTEIRQFTLASGTIQFDLYFLPVDYLAEDVTLLALETTLTWPAAWELIEWEACGDAVASFQVTENSGALDIVWEEGLTIPDDLVRVGRFKLDVTEFGALETSGTAQVTWSLQDFGESTTFPFSLAGEAGRVCGECAWGCPRVGGCYPEFYPRYLDLQMTAGTRQVVELSSFFRSAVCEPDYSSTESWASIVGVIRTGPPESVYVGIDTEELLPGSYEAHVLADADCRACCWIRLEVLYSPPAAQSTTWSEVKTRFR